MLFKVVFGGNHSRVRGKENPETQTEGEGLALQQENSGSPSMEGT